MKGNGWTGGRPVALKRLQMRMRADYLDRARPAHVPLVRARNRTGITTAIIISTNARRCQRLPDIPTSTTPPAVSASN